MGRRWDKKVYLLTLTVVVASLPRESASFAPILAPNPRSITFNGKQTSSTATLRRRIEQGKSSFATPKDNDYEVEEGRDEDSLSWLLTLCLPLWLVYVSNQWSRYSLSYLVDFSSTDPVTAMNVDLGFDEASYGILASVAFTSLFAIASLGAGFAADRYNRKTLTVVSALAWSLTVLGTASAQDYAQVVAFRIAMGLACGFSTPSAYTLIQQRVPSQRVALASSLYGTGVALGSGLSSLSIIMDSALGWRQTLVAISALGFGSAAASVVLLPDDPKESEKSDSEPKQQGSASEGLDSILGDVSEAFSTTRAQWLYLGSFLRFCSGLCIGVWGPPYFRMVFPEQQAEYSVAQAAISAVGASVSGLLGGAAADWLAETASSSSDNDGSQSSLQLAGQDATGRRMWVSVVGSLLAAPAWYFAVHSVEGATSLGSPFEISMAWLAAEYLVAECWFGPTISTLQSTVGRNIGGTAQGLFTLTGAMANFAPTALGYIYGQAIAGTGESSTAGELSNLLTAAVCFGYLSSAFCFGMAALSTPSSLLVKEEN